MLNLTKYNLDDEDIVWLYQIRDWCIKGQSEIILEYKGKSFVLEPHGEEVEVVEAVDRIVGKYKDFDDLLLNHKIDGKPLIELVPELQFGE